MNDTKIPNLAEVKGQIAKAQDAATNALTYTRAQLTAGTANPPALATRIWDEHGSLRVRTAAAGEKADQGITFALAGGRMAEREWDGKNVYTKWYGLKPGDDVSGYVPALAAVPESGVLHWTPGKYMHGLAGYAGKGDKYNPLWVIKKHRFTMKMAGVTVEAAPDLPNTTYYGGWLFLGCTHFRVEGWPVYDGRIDLRDPQKFQAYDGDGNPIKNPDGTPKMIYGDPSWANLLLDGWRPTVGCVDAHLQVVGVRCLMDGVICCGGSGATDPILTGEPPKDVYLDKCVSSGNARQGLSVVGVDGLTIDGGIYELTGTTQGPDGVERGMPPMAGIDLEGELVLHNKRVKIINKPEVRYNRGSGLYVHQFTENLDLQSLHSHHNGGYGLLVDDKSVGTKLGAGVLLEMNGRNTEAGAEPFELVFYGEGSEANGVTIITDAARAISNGGTKKGQKLLNVTVRSVATDNSKPSGWVSLYNPDIIVEGLTTENVVPYSGFGAVHVENLTTGTIRNSRIRTSLDNPGAAISGKAVNASGNQTAGYAQGDKLKVTPPTAAVPVDPVRVLFDDARARTLNSAYTGKMDPADAELLTTDAAGWTYRITSFPTLEAGSGTDMRFAISGRSGYRVSAIYSSRVVSSDGTRTYTSSTDGRSVYVADVPTTLTPLTVGAIVRVEKA